MPLQRFIHPTSSPLRLMRLLWVLCLLAGAAQAREVTDMAGRKVTVPDRIERVLGTAPPLTALMYALAPDQLVALTLPLQPGDARYLPPRLATLPLAGGLIGMGPRLQAETMLELKPDVALAWGGKVSMANVDEVVRQFDRIGVPVLFVNVDTLADWPAALRFVGDLLGRPQRAAELAAEVEGPLASVAKAVGDIPDAQRVRVYYAEGPDGLSTECHSSFHVEPIALAGGFNVHRCTSSSHVGLEKVSLEQVLAYDPDVIVVQDRAALDRMGRDGPWRSVRALREGRVLVVPGAPLNWIDRPPSFMRALGIQWLAAAFYPQRYGFHPRMAARAFYTRFFGVAPSDKDLDDLFSQSAEAPAPGSVHHHH